MGAFPVNVAAGEVTIGIRPEHVHINQSGDGQADGTITLVEYLGSEVFIYIALADQHRAGELLLSRCALACRFPAGLRLVIGSAGELLAIKGLSSRTITGRLEWNGRPFDIAVAPNQLKAFTGDGFEIGLGPALVLPSHG